MSRETYQLGTGERQWQHDRFWREREWVTWGEIAARTAVDKCWDVDSGFAIVLLDAKDYFDGNHSDDCLLNVDAPGRKFLHFFHEEAINLGPYMLGCLGMVSTEPDMFRIQQILQKDTFRSLQHPSLSLNNLIGTV